MSKRRKIMIDLRASVEDGFKGVMACSDKILKRGKGVKILSIDGTRDVLRFMCDNAIYISSIIAFNISTEEFLDDILLQENQSLKEKIKILMYMLT